MRDLLHHLPAGPHIAAAPQLGELLADSQQFTDDRAEPLVVRVLEGGGGVAVGSEPPRGMVVAGRRG
ncbi:hypothetical protein [Streptantibioticus ferralitis]|uniref:Uncharacterized protein n=1 Tax=Streptantibioticus ferralitis TaxID=236510 RepID=A0ABT5Z2L6_9ACTN|nr:hypothetical protein [Streptantibioticus ferralitis]MDF2258067.1 hypothetical protein [Streptantibioticus ferralitis]